jgi:hypothetical protein
VEAFFSMRDAHSPLFPWEAIRDLTLLPCAAALAYDDSVVDCGLFQLLSLTDTCSTQMSKYKFLRVLRAPPRILIHVSWIMRSKR